MKCSMILILMMTLISAGNAWAFSCQYRTPQPAEVYLKHSDAVIVGKVLAVSAQEVMQNKKGSQLVKLKVEVLRSYKGVKTGVIELDIEYSVLTMDSPPAFGINEEYFFPITFNKNSGHYELKTACSGYFLLDKNSKLLIEMEK